MVQPSHRQLRACHGVVFMDRPHLEDIDRVGDLSQLNDAGQDSSVPTILAVSRLTVRSSMEEVIQHRKVRISRVEAVTTAAQ